MREPGGHRRHGCQQNLMGERCRCRNFSMSERVRPWRHPLRLADSLRIYARLLRSACNFVESEATRAKYSVATAGSAAHTRVYNGGLMSPYSSSRVSMSLPYLVAFEVACLAWIM